MPASPWEKVGVDLFTLYKKPYVIAVDYYSKFVEMAQLRDESATSVIDNIKKIFSRHGIAKELCSDNGSQFSSKEFRDFSKQWDFRHTTSSPEYPKSNGLVERHIQTLKRALKKSHESKQDPYLALLSLNNTPNETGESPASLLFGRHPRTPIPSVIKPKTKHIPIRKDSKKRYDTRSKDLAPIEPNTTVRIYSKNRNGNWRQKGQILSKRSEPRSYTLQNEKGNIIRRNRSQLLPTNERYVVENEISSNESENEEETEKEIVLPSNEVNIESQVENQYTTRYGRTIRPPDRYGIEN